MENPIKNSRIVSDYTYAVRLLSHLAGEYPSVSGYHPLIEEDYEYLVRTAVNLLIYQFETCPDDEKWYFENLVKDCKSGKQLIEEIWEKDFVRYLKVIKAI